MRLKLIKLGTIFIAFYLFWLLISYSPSKLDGETRIAMDMSLNTVFLFYMYLFEIFGKD